MTIEMPCFVGETVFADLRESKKRKPRIEDLTECYISNIEFDKAWPHPLFTAIRSSFDICHTGQDDFGKFWDTDFGKSVFTKEQYYKMKE